MDSLASALPGTSSYVGYPLLRGVPLFVWGTSIHMGYLILYEVPLFVWGTSICMMYLKSRRASRIVRDTSDCAGIIPLIDTWRFTTFPIFPSNR